MYRPSANVLCVHSEVIGPLGTGAVGSRPDSPWRGAREKRSCEKLGERSMEVER